MSQKNIIRVNQFFADNNTQSILNRFKAIGCTIENLDDLDKSPVYINCKKITQSGFMPYVGVYEPSEMKLNKIDFWLGVETDKSVDGIGEFETPEQLCNYLSDDIGLSGPIISGYSHIVFDFISHIDSFNRN